MKQIKTIEEINKDLQNAHYEAGKIESLLMTIIGYIDSVNGDSDLAPVVISASEDSLEILFELFSAHLNRLEELSKFVNRLSKLMSEDVVDGVDGVLADE